MVRPNHPKRLPNKNIKNLNKPQTDVIILKVDLKVHIQYHLIFHPSLVTKKSYPFVISRHLTYGPIKILSGSSPIILSSLSLSSLLLFLSPLSRRRNPRSRRNYRLFIFLPAIQLGSFRSAILQVV